MAQYNLGVMYAQGRGVPEDLDEALRWLREAAGQGDAAAQYNLGFMYAEGIGVGQDDVEAVRWYQAAAEQGNSNAQDALKAMYAEGRGGGQDDSEAPPSYRDAAEQGDADAQFNLGLMYAEGDGVEQNETEAVRWYHEAARQEMRTRSITLDTCMKMAEAFARTWRRRCAGTAWPADQGDAAARYNLGYMYDYGQGVPQNDSEAALLVPQGRQTGLCPRPVQPRVHVRIRPGRRPGRR